MKANSLSNNIFSSKVAENQISKYTRPEFLSSANQFKNLIKKSEDKNNEEKNKFEQKDIHQDKLQERLQKKNSVEQDDIFSLLTAQNTIEPKNIFETPEFELSIEDKNVKTKILENLGIKNEVKDVLTELSKVNSVDKLNNTEEEGKFKLNDKFKLQENSKFDDKIKLQESLKNTDLQGANKLDHQKMSAQKQKLGLNSTDTKSKNDFNLQNTLRSKNIGLKNKLGRDKAAKIYQQSQPVSSDTVDSKKIENTDINLDRVRKVKIAKPFNISKSNSDNLKNDFLANNLDSEHKTEKSTETSKNEFSKLMNLQDQFKSEGVDDLVKQSQFLAKKGGGEMKLLLNPKGLGEVKLKVLMQENQIKIEMLADNEDAREVIESTLGDLRKALGNNQLQVDSITVDTFDRLGEMLANQEDGAEFAQDFLSEFRQQNNDFRQGVLEFPVVKRRGSQIVEDTNLNVKSKDSSRRLDLVA